MVADIARVTYDPTREYRSVIYQQGRVTLEADNNEAEAIEGEALRLETIDIVGPAGTPDNGYQVTSGTGPAGFDVGPGIFYLGGWRLEEDAQVDVPGDPNSKTDIELARQGGDFVVCLLITERSVGAVEDQALREVALGGPDSAARSRLMQTFPRVATDGDTCAAGAVSVAALLAAEGVTIDPYSDELVSSATLQAGFTPSPPSTDPCQPAAAGGYLGADNQMVRVTVTAFDAKAQTGTLLWGWNNASLLYRATANDPLTLTLTTTPVDEEHAPQQNQMVEILAVDLDLGDNNYIADGEGFVVALAQGYSFDTGQIILSNPLPAQYLGANAQLFVRLWQAEVPFNAGVQTPLDTVSGITVAIAMTALPTRIAARPFWRFAVRPATPTSIYPQRYLDAPQPPDGPRQWICDLAVCKALDDGCTVLEDCRPTFVPLTQISGGCCGLVLGPDDVTARGGLQAVVDSLGGLALLSLKPGTYGLSAPLALTSAHDGLTIESCAGGVIFQADANADLTTFRSGLVVMDGVAEITLRGLVFIAPEVPLTPAGAKQSKLKISTVVAILVRTVHALTIEDCLFSLSSTAAESFGAGVFVAGPSVGVTITGNEFSAATRIGIVVGVLAMITAASAGAAMDRWDVSENRFENLFCAVVGFAQLGLVSARHNVVVGGGTGIVLAEANLGAASGFTRQAFTVAGAQDPLAQAAYAALRPDMLAKIINGGAPILAAQAPPVAPEVSDVARQTLADQLRASGVAAYAAMTAGANTGAEAAAASAKTGAAAPKAASIDTASFDTIDAAAVQAEILERTLTPAIRLEDNEITLTAGKTALWVGLGVVLSPDEPGSVIVSGNRVVVPDSGTVACALLLAEGAIVTGNFFWQLNAKPAGGPVVPSLAVVNAGPALAVTGNVIVWTDFIAPQRTLPQPSAAFEFLNTVL